MPPESSASRAMGVAEVGVAAEGGVAAEEFGVPPGTRGVRTTSLGWATIGAMTGRGVTAAAGALASAAFSFDGTPTRGSKPMILVSSANGSSSLS